jgi:hypothetical protein
LAGVGAPCSNLLDARSNHVAAATENCDNENLRESPILNSEQKSMQKQNNIAGRIQQMENALERLLELAISDDEEMDPNKRCAVITLALAILIEPEKVTIENIFGLKVEYGLVTIRLPKKGSSSFLFSIIKIFNFRSSNSKKYKDAPKETYIVLQDLAESYSDHKRNIESRKHLKKYLPMAHDALAKAAVLGIAWATLQRHEISQWYEVSSGADSGHWIAAKEIGVSLQLQIRGNAIISANYQGLSSAMYASNSPPTY